jgi:heme a synthase
VKKLQRSLKILSVATTIVLLFVLLGGALVTKTDSGAGCGRSWPLCHGQLIPEEIPVETIIELSHRVVAGLASILVTALSILCWRRYGHVKEVKVLSAISFLFLFAQALFGAAAVIWGQSSFVLALHFGVSLISFTAVVLLMLLLFEIDKKFDAESLAIGKKMKFHIYGISIYTYLVVYTGALVRHKKASMACPDFPFCSNNNIGLPTQIQEWVQMSHRTAAILLFVWITIATVHALRHYKSQKVMYWGWIIAFILVTSQALTGILSVFTNINLFIALFHALFISCLFALLSYFIMLSTRSKKTNTSSLSRDKLA